jgi:hypothetical protein
MSVPELPSHELDAVRELLDVLVAALDHEHAPMHPADVEMLALDLQAPFARPDAPPELARELPATLARLAKPVAADLLVAIERLAPEPLAGFAAEQRARLERDGTVGLHGRHVGGATLAEAFAYSAADGAVEIWHAVLRRPESGLSQAIVVIVEHEPCGAVIVGVVAAEPGDSSVPDVLRRRAEVGPAERLGAEELLRRLRVTLEHMERHDLALDSEAAIALPLLERALTGSVGRLPRPEVEHVDEEAALQEHADDLVDAFAQVLEQDEHASPALRENGPYIAHCMLDWKLGYADGNPGRWTLGDLRELLLDWFPRKVTADDETIEIAADAVMRFLRFLADEGLLDAPVPLSSLEAAVVRLRPRFERACGDPRRWGPSKALVAEMVADGVDMGDERAVESWIEGYNARLLDRRTVAPARPAPAKRAKRKAVRQARRRNRH